VSPQPPVHQNLRRTISGRREPFLLPQVPFRGRAPGSGRDWPEQGARQPLDDHAPVRARIDARTAGPGIRVSLRRTWRTLCAGPVGGKDRVGLPAQLTPASNHILTMQIDFMENSRSGHFSFTEAAVWLVPSTEDTRKAVFDRAGRAPRGGGPRQPTCRRGSAGETGAGDPPAVSSRRLVICSPV
jgi:hypothetical protein